MMLRQPPAKSGEPYPADWPKFKDEMCGAQIRRQDPFITSEMEEKAMAEAHLWLAGRSKRGDHVHLITLLAAVLLDMAEDISDDEINECLKSWEARR